MLSVTIHEAKDLMAADPNGFSDPYALVFVGKNKPKKTKIIKKNLNPKWEEVFEFPLTRRDQTLQIQVWDWDAVGSDDFLGLVHIDLSPAFNGNPQGVKDGWLKLQPHPNKKVQVKGGINITVAVKEQKYAAASSKDVDKVVSGKIRSVTNMFDIQGVGATAFSVDWVNSLPQGLEIIQCGFNKLTTLPGEIARFVQLQQFFAAGNQISAWPPALCNLAALTELEINGNELTTLPDSFGRLQGLEKLNIANNKLVRLPGSIGYLYRLEDLNLSGNELDTVPDTIGNCFHLEVLDLSCNAITALPEEITYCTRLIELNLGSNRLQALPEAVGRLSRVVSLNVSDNQIRDFPVSIGYCASLAQIGQGLNIDRNPLTDPELAQQYRIGADRLYSYLEKRMFIVGSPQLPPFPNNGRLPFVPMPPVDGQMLGFGTAGGGAAPAQKPRFGPSDASLQPSPINLKNRQSGSHTGSPLVQRSNSGGPGSGANSPAVAHSPSPGTAAAAAGPLSKDEKVEKIRTVAKAVIEQDIRPKINALKAQIDACTSLPAAQPLVLKVKSLKNDFDSIKTILPPIDKMPPPERAPNEDSLVTLKKVVAMIVFEYDLILGISLSVAEVASAKDLVTLVGALKKIKALL